MSGNFNTVVYFGRGMFNLACKRLELITVLIHLKLWISMTTGSEGYVLNDILSIILWQHVITHLKV